MIETINNAPDLLEDFQLEVKEPITDLSKKENEVKKPEGQPEEKKTEFNGIIKSNSQQADEFSKLLLGEEEVEKTDDKPKDDLPEKEDKKEEVKTEVEKPVIKEPEEESSNYSFKGILEYLDSEGVVDYDDEIKKLDDSPELLTMSINKKIENGINSFIDSLPDVVSELTDYINKGGDPAKYLQALYKPIDVNDLDLDEEADQELIVREYLKSQELDLTDVDDLIQSYKDGLILDKQAKVAVKKIGSIYEKQKQILLQEQDEQIEQQRLASEKYVEQIQSTITGSKALAGLEISDKEKKEFSDYLLKVNPKNGKTKYQEDLAQDYVKSSVELAYLKYKKYDFSKAEKSGATKATKDIKDKIFTKQEKAPSGRTRETANTVDFSAFKSFGYSQGR